MALQRAQTSDDPAETFSRLGELSRQLRECGSVGELLAATAAVIRNECGFSRAVILGIDGRTFNATDSDALSDPSSDRLRRAVLAQPVPLVRGSEEETQIRAAGGETPGPTTRSSPLVTQLQLHQYVLEPIVLEGRALALLVLDRDVPEVDPLERALAASYAAILALLLEPQLLQARVDEVASELRRLTTFSDALMRETLTGQLALPSARDRDFLTAWISAPEATSPTRPELLLSAQELRVAKLLAAGNSNRQIAAELVLSVDTIKSHVARVLHKLGVANRAQAAVVMASR
jgi:LuxR family transcriptional regulator, regulator of acetate metabolism